MKSILSIATLLFFFLPGFSQYTKEIKAAFQDGEYFLAYQAYQDALSGYQKVYKVDPDNANINYRIGICYLNIPGQKAKAIPYLEKATGDITGNYKEGSLKERKAPYDTYFFLGNAYHLQYNFNKAKENYEKYLNLLDPVDSVNRKFVSQQITDVKNAPELIKHPVYYRATDAGNLINTTGADFDPVVSADESVMVYVTSLKFYDALFFVKKGPNSWGRPVNITPQVQSDGDLYPTALSPDGKTLLMSRNDKFNSDIWVSYYKKNAWTIAVKLGKNINTKFWESSASFSPDGKTLYFTSNRNESLGGLDIFTSQWDENTKEWGPAVNLGPVINSSFNEETPFLCADGKTLFFSSQGFNNMGGFDIFYSTLQDNGTWSKPVNMGYPINTTDDDLGYVPVKNGEFGYYAMYDPDLGLGDKDIYKLEVYSDKNPRPVIISGKITLKDLPSGYSGTIKVSVIDKNNGTEISSASVQPDNGTYQLTIRKTGPFDIRVTGDHYTPAVQTITIPQDYSLGSLETNATLLPEKPVVQTVWLPTIFFDFDKSLIRKAEHPKVKELVRIMNEHPDLSIELLGYTDAKGSTAYNKRLALRRAREVRKALLNAGIDASRVKVTGVGEKDFVAINNWPDGKDCPEGRTYNRRVSVKATNASGDYIKPEQIQVPDQLKIK
ncbi:MAG: OmpA family protein [Chlorobi bacterium]|nr:OmpA family protein [Chlorobiota bacterium]